MDMNSDLYDKLIDKSKEAFIMAIELYNKPTIKYRVEGFSLFICNAWELMLKAYMIKSMGENSIYYKDNQDRTLSLENCVSKIFTNNKDPLRLNLEKIIELRNTSTHFITEEYEMVYVPLFQSCIINFNEKMKAFHDVDMTSIIPQNFLTLSVSMKALKDTEIIAKYPEKIAQKLLNVKDNIEDIYNNKITKFTSFHFTNLCKYYKIKENEKFCYVHKQFTNPQYSYSQQAIDFVVLELEKDPEHILDNIKNKLTPGAKEF